MDKVVDVKEIPFRKSQDNHFILDVVDKKYEFFVEDGHLKYYLNSGTYEKEIYGDLQNVINDLKNFQVTDITRKCEYLEYCKDLERLRTRLSLFNANFDRCLKEKEFYYSYLNKSYANLFKLWYSLISVEGIVYKTELKENTYTCTILVSPV